MTVKIILTAHVWYILVLCVFFSCSSELGACSSVWEKRKAIHVLLLKARLALYLPLELSTVTTGLPQVVSGSMTGRNLSSLQSCLIMLM